MSWVLYLLEILLQSMLERLIEWLIESLLQWEKVISPCEICCKELNLWLSPVTTITANHGIEPRAFVHTAGENHKGHVQHMMAFLPYRFPLVYKLSVLGVKAEVIVHDVASLLFNFTIFTLTRV